MKMQIKEFADFTGVSVRTLHYYDEIGLLKPASTDKHTGYRWYDDTSLERMQEILFYRELDFPLKSICSILSAPDYDRNKALENQKKLLLLKLKRLERIISILDTHQKGEYAMKAFNNTEFETARKQYEKEAKEKWGNTNAYEEYAQNTKNHTPEKHQESISGMESILAEFAICMNCGNSPDSSEAQILVKKLQNFITAHFYTCTDEIITGLGKMYTADERFRKNIDRHAEGNAEFISRAIQHYTAAV